MDKIVLDFRGNLAHTFVTMNDDEFTKLLKYMQEFRKEVNEKLDMKADKDRVYSALDAILKRSETHEQERLFADHQIDRHEDWIKQLTTSTKTKLIPEP